MLTNDARGRRVRAIAFTHNSHGYTATVGEYMRKRAVAPLRRKKVRVEYVEPDLITSDKVIDIQPGVPTWLVYLDPNASSRYWINPFMVGPQNITAVWYFED